MIKITHLKDIGDLLLVCCFSIYHDYNDYNENNEHTKTS